MRKLGGSWPNQDETTNAQTNHCVNATVAMERYIGIDPDGHGGFAVLDVWSGGTQAAQCFSVSNNDAFKMDEMLQRFLPDANVVWIERPFHPRGKGMAAVALQERGIGLWNGLIFKNKKRDDVCVEEVPPVTWRKYFNFHSSGSASPNTKVASVRKVLELFPGLVSCKVTHGSCEALLIAVAAKECTAGRAGPKGAKPPKL